jgi:hypothetical protein
MLVMATARQRPASAATRSKATRRSTASPAIGGSSHTEGAGTEETRAAAERAQRHRTAAGLALRDLDDAATFLEQMGLLVQSPHPYLPSLFGAAQGEPAKANAAGFGRWPAHAWSWAGELAERSDVLLTKVLLGQRTLVHRRLWPALDAAVRGREPVGADERAVCAVLEQRPTLRTDELRDQAELGGEAGRKRYQKAMQQLEWRGLVVCRPVLVDEHRHVSLARGWHTLFPQPLGADSGLIGFMLAVIVAAGGVPAKELPRWFGWPRAEVEQALGVLLASGALRAAHGLLQP